MLTPLPTSLALCCPSIVLIKSLSFVQFVEIFPLLAEEAAAAFGLGRRHLN